MHPLKSLREWYNIVHWTPLIMNQDVNTRYLRSYPPFWMDFKIATVKKRTKCLNDVISASYHLLCLLFLSKTSIFKTLNIFCIEILTNDLKIVYSRWPPL